MYFNSEGISEAASSPSLCDFRRCAAAGDAHFRLPPDDGSSSVDAFNADTPLSYKRSPDRSRKTYKLTRVITAEICLTPDLQQAVVRSRSAVDSRPRSESSVVSSLNEKATASRRTHCFFESIFLRSLPVTPAREVSHNLLLESCTSMPTPVEADRPVIKTVRKHWCIVFCSSTPAQVLPSPRSYLVPSNLDCPCKHRCIDCPTGDAIDWPSSEQNILQKCSSMTRRVNRSFRYSLEHQITSRVSDDPSPVLAVEFKEEFNLQLELLYQQPQSWQSCAESTSESIYLQPAVSRREKVLFYCELSDCDETVTDWQMAAFYKLQCHPVTARCIREKPTASSDWRMEQWRIQCNEPQCAPLTEVPRPALHYSSGASTGDCGCTTDCQQMKPQWPPAPDPHSSHRTRDSDCCTSVSYSNVHSAPERRGDKRWRQRRRAPLDSPSASAVSTQSAETESAVLHTAIARGGFDHLLQTLERARLRYSGSAVSATFSCPGTGSRRRHRRQQSKACSFQTCPATCDLGSENDRNEEIEDEDVEESELENTQVLHGNQSNFEDNDCSDEFCACDTKYCSCNFRTCCCEGDYQCNDGLAGPSVQPLIDHSTASQRERREAKIIDSMSQSLLTLTKSLESCVRHIRGTVAELQRCSESDSIVYS